jgi:LmbE family N-acetylglucosaminyl deacetylase
MSRGWLAGVLAERDIPGNLDNVRGDELRETLIILGWTNSKFLDFIAKMSFCQSVFRL